MYERYAEPGVVGAPYAGASPDADDDRLRVSDVAKLARRTRRRIVRTARAGDRPTFTKLLAAHLGALEDLEVVEESWPTYEHVNVQVALDAWLAQEGREHQLVGMTRFRHSEFGLTDLLRHEADYEYGPTPVPGNVAWTNLPSGPSGEVTQCVRAGVFLIEDGDARAAVLLVGADPERGGSTGVQLHVASDRPGQATAIAQTLRALSVEHNVFRRQFISFGRDMAASARPSCSSTLVRR